MTQARRSRPMPVSMFFCLQLGVVAVAVVVELGENDVPDLHIAVAVAADGAVRACRSRTSRRGRSRSQSRGRRDRSRAPRSCPPCRSGRYGRRGMPISLCPDVEGLVVVLDRWTDTERSVGHLQTPRCRNSHAQRDGLVLEVIAEGEVAQHLEDRCRGGRSCRRSRYRRCGCTSGRW